MLSRFWDCLWSLTPVQHLAKYLYKQGGEVLQQKGQSPLNCSARVLEVCKHEHKMLSKNQI